MGWELKRIQKFGPEKQVLKELPKAPILRRLIGSQLGISYMIYYGSKSRGIVLKVFSKEGKSLCAEKYLAVSADLVCCLLSLCVLTYFENQILFPLTEMQLSQVISEYKWQGQHYVRVPWEERPYNSDLSHYSAKWLSESLSFSPLC